MNVGKGLGMQLHAGAVSGLLTFGLYLRKLRKVWERNMDFYKRVGMVCRAVPGGKVASYGQIALLCGKPHNSRQVGYALKQGLAGEIPAHRIVNGKGVLTGAASFDYPGMQRLLLEDEGVEVLPSGDRTGSDRVDMKRYGWKNTLEEAEALARQFKEMGI